MKINKSALMAGAMALAVVTSGAVSGFAAESGSPANSEATPFFDTVVFKDKSIGFGPAVSDNVSKVSVFVQLGDEPAERSASVRGFAGVDPRTGTVVVTRYAAQAATGATISGIGTVFEFSAQTFVDFKGVFAQFTDGQLKAFLSSLTDEQLNAIALQLLLFFDIDVNDRGPEESIIDFFASLNRDTLADAIILTDDADVLSRLLFTQFNRTQPIEFPVIGRGRYVYDESAVIDASTGRRLEDAKILRGNYRVTGRFGTAGVATATAQRQGLQIRSRANSQAPWQTSGSLGEWLVQGSTRTDQGTTARYNYDGGDAFGSRADFTVPNHRLQVSPNGRAFRGNGTISGMTAVFDDADGGDGIIYDELVVFESSTPIAVNELRPNDRREGNYLLRMQSRTYGRVQATLDVDGVGPVFQGGSIIIPSPFASPFTNRRAYPLTTLVSNAGARERYNWTFVNRESPTELD